MVGDRKWLGDMVDWLRQADPTRLVVDNSPCAPNYHVKTDINDYHYYRSLPERRDEWDALTDAFADRPDWAFTCFAPAGPVGKLLNIWCSGSSFAVYSGTTVATSATSPLPTARNAS